MNKTRQILEAGLFTTMLVIMITGSFYIPLIGTAFFFLSPLPVIILSIRNIPVNIVVSGIVGIIISGFLVSFMVAFTAGALALCVGIPLGIAIKRFESPLKAMAIGTLGAIMAMILSISLMNFAMGFSIDQTLDALFSTSKEIQTELEKTLEIYSGSLTADQQGQIKAALDDSEKNMENLMEFTKLLFPAGLVMMAITFAALNYFVVLLFLKRLKIAHRPLGSFKTFSYPRHLAYGGAGMLLGAYILGTLGIVDMNTIMMNFIYLFIMIFYVQGLAVGYFFLRRSMSKGISVTILVAVSLLGLMGYIALIGFMDVVLDVRRLQPKKR